MRRSYSGLRRIAVNVARAQRALDRANAQASRQILAAQRMSARQAKADLIEIGEGEAVERTSEIKFVEQELSTILKLTARKSAVHYFNLLMVKAKHPRFDSKGLERQLDPPTLDSFLPEPRSFLAKLLPIIKNNYDTAVVQGQRDFEAALKQHEETSVSRKRQLERLQTEHERICKTATDEALAANDEVAALRSAYEAADRTAVIEYFTIVFDQEDLPEGIPTNFRVTYDPDSKQLLIEQELPLIEAIPTEALFRYVKRTDSVVSVDRKPADRKSLYANVLSQLALRSIRLALNADSNRVVEVFSFNGFVNTIDLRTGTKVKPTLISLTASRASMESIDFDLVDPAQCLRGLRALVSRNAPELEAVRPLVQFDMIDRRFIDKVDVLSDLESRPNLAELTPSEFEALMTNLFEKMGLETRLTQASRDGGVDCVAWDMRPVIGGKVVIQAKRYRNTVGVSAVRDLYGTMMNEGAAKGILVATTGYGDSAYEFVKNKPLELITGSNLLSMLEEYAHIKARIEFPQEWVDPVI